MTLNNEEEEIELSLPRLNISPPEMPLITRDKGRDFNKLTGRVSVSNTFHSTQLPNSWRWFSNKSEYKISELDSSPLALDIEENREEELLMIFDH
jgi:hypothetical protein